MEDRDVLTRTSELPDAVLRYGDHSDAVIDVHLPPRSLPPRSLPPRSLPPRSLPTRSNGEPRSASPLIVLIHGGFWHADYDRMHTRPLANALAAEGFVVASPEYRRVGGGGDLAGGWPTTFDDMSAVMESLPGFLDELDIAVSRTTVMGFSAGGHLALWLANEPHSVDRVIGLAPVGDVHAAAEAHLGGDAVHALLCGSPSQVPDRYDAVDPAIRLATPPSCDVVVIHGVDDDIVPVENSRGLGAKHPFVVIHELEGIEHFALIDPLSAAWPVVRASAAAEAIDLG